VKPEGLEALDSSLSAANKRPRLLLMASTTKILMAVVSRLILLMLGPEEVEEAEAMVVAEVDTEVEAGMEAINRAAEEAATRVVVVVDMVVVDIAAVEAATSREATNKEATEVVKAIKGFGQLLPSQGLSYVPLIAFRPTSS